MSESCNLGLHPTPGNIRVAESRVENHRGTSLSGTDDVHLASPDIDQTAGHGIEAPVASFGDIFVKKSGEGREEDY